MTHTYVFMKVSQSAYDEIKRKLEGAGYHHALHEDREDGTLLDMHGIALRPEHRELVRNKLVFDEVHVGYWTGDHECACFNPISPLNVEESSGTGASVDWYDACTYIRLEQLDKTKKYRVTLHVEAEEIP